MRVNPACLRLLLLCSLLLVAMRGVPPHLPAGSDAIPTLNDEMQTYQRWGWTWTAGQVPNLTSGYCPSCYGGGGPTGAFTVSNIDSHGDTEGDDLDTSLAMFLRTGQRGYLERAQAWARYFKDDYRQCIDNGAACTSFACGTYSRTYCYDQNSFTMDHAYGWGLLAWARYLGAGPGAAYTTVAADIAADIKAIYDSQPTFYLAGTLEVGYYTTRGLSRNLLLATRLAEATGLSQWGTLRDRIIQFFLQSPDWNATHGIYFAGQPQTDTDINAGTYATGIRIVSPFIQAIQAEAFAQAYRTTGNATLRTRLIAQARFVETYGLDATYQYVGHRFGVNINDLTPFHSYSSARYQAQPPTFWDPVYTTSLVNILVRGYKYTGERHFLDSAKLFFNRGTKGVYGSPTARAATDTAVGHFMDSRFDSSSNYFYYKENKGELQYTYLLFENGGEPTLE